MEPPVTVTRLLIAAALAVSVTACSQAPAPTAAPDEVREPATPAPSSSPAAAPDDAGSPARSLPEGRSLIATAEVEELEVREEPDEEAPVVHRLAHPTERGAPRVLLVEQEQDAWFEVLLPIRPNGSRGWIRAEDVGLSQTGYAVDVDLTAFELTVTSDDEVVLTSPIAYGTEDTPTPGGRYFVTELLQPPDPDGVYGSFAFGLSGFSDVLLSFAGGEGVIGIHGTNDPDSIGERVSAGCIRLPDDVVIELAGMLPLGTPVTISG